MCGGIEFLFIDAETLLMKRFKNFIFLLFIFFGQSLLAQEITLIWGDTLSKLIFQYNDRNLSNWKELLPLYLSLNPEIKNSNLIYAGNKLIIPTEEEVAVFIGSEDSLNLDELRADEESAVEETRELASLIDYVSTPWSLEFQVGPYFKYDESNNGIEYTSKGGFNLSMRAIYHLNDKYSIGLSSRYTKQGYKLSQDSVDFNLSGLYIKTYMNWNKFIVSALLGFRDRLVYDTSSSLLMARHLDYGAGLGYRLMRGRKWEAIAGLNLTLFSPSTSLPEGINQKGYDIKAKFRFDYQLWENSLLGLESVYSLSKGTNKLYDINLEDFITRLSLQFNF